MWLTTRLFDTVHGGFDTVHGVFVCTQVHVQLKSVFFLIFFIQNAATVDKSQSTGCNFCCLMMPTKKAHLAQDRYKYSSKTAFIYQQAGCAFTDNSVKQQELNLVLCTLPHVNVFSNKKYRLSRT